MALEELSERFPAFERLSFGGRADRVPVVRAMTPIECGPACVAMVLGYHGKHVGLQELRAAFNTQEAVDAQSLLDVAHLHGLTGRGVSLDVPQLSHLDPGSILFWEFNHFVVFERATASAVFIVDPAAGRRRISMAEFRRAFTGVALLFETSAHFQEEASKGSALIRLILSTLKERTLWPGVLITSLLLQVFALGVPLITALIVETILPGEDRDLLVLVGAGLAVLVVLQLLGTLVRSHLLLAMRVRLESRLAIGLMDQMGRLPYRFFQQREAGELGFLVGATVAVGDLLTSVTLSAALDGLCVVLYLALLVLFSGKLGLLVGAFGAAQLLLFWFSRHRLLNLAAEQLVQEQRCYNAAYEVIDGIETLKAMGVERAGVERWSHRFVDMVNARIARGQLNAYLESAVSTLRMATPLVLLGVGANEVLAGRMSLSEMLAINALGVGFILPLSSLVFSALQLQILKTYADRLEDVFSAEPEQPAHGERPKPKLDGAVSLRAVSFRYGPLVPPAVRDISFSVKPGEFVAIVGPSGSGKSTLAKLISGLYVPSSGAVYYDAHDLTTLDLTSVRRQVGYVPQRPTFACASLRANIANFDAGASLEDVISACRAAHVHEEILAMPMGYETIMLGRGTSVSGGQLQRIALARALIRRPTLLLLDEATSALDSLTEQAVQSELAHLSCTRIVVAHRLSTVMNADRILVVDGGAVVAEGTHAELMERSDLYRRLFAAQLAQRGP